MKRCLLVVCVISILYAPAAPAESLRDWADQSLSDEAVVIARVTVISIQESQQSKNIYYTVQVDDCVKGALTARNMLIRVPQSYFPAQKVGSRRPLDIGQDATLYLKNGPQGTLRSSLVLALVPSGGDIRYEGPFS